MPETAGSSEKSALGAVRLRGDAEPVLRLHHAQITLPRGAEDEGRRFYCGVLGLTEIPKPDALQNRGGFWLELAGFPIHVGTEDGVDRRATKAHLAYEVSDVAAWRTRIEALGLPVLDAVRIPGFSRFEARDPWGNRIEFIQVL